MSGTSPRVAGLRETFVLQSTDPRWVKTAIGRAQVALDGHLHLVVNEGRQGQLALAQLDDYTCRPRPRYPWSPPLVLETRARFSQTGGKFLGTAGFGFWNNPAPLWGTRLEVNPNWIWFYYASPESTLSFTPGPPHGFKAAVVYGGRGGTLAMALGDAALRVPVLGRALAGSRLPAVEAPLDGTLMGDWHTYRIAWLPDHIFFQVDGHLVLDTRRAPAAPLAFVAWVDNNVAAVSPRGEIQLGNLRIGQPQWLEMEYLSIARA